MPVNFSRWWRGRLFMGALMLAVMAGFYFYPQPQIWAVLTFCIALAGAHEWGKLCHFGRKDNLLYVGAFAVFALLASWWREDVVLHQAFFAMMAFFWVGLAPWWTLKKCAPAQQWQAAAGLLVLYAVWSAAALLYQYDLQLLFACMVLVWVFDSACYFTGKAVGVTKLAPTLSPGKTVEGLLGGVGAVLVGSVLYNYFWAAERQTLAAVLAAGFSLAILAALGDMFISALKRNAGSKDTGALLGDHGGILDRTDSLLPVLPWVVLL